jgi:predicted hotdog family 3-hydroxylacyl-ACP dehydratase
MSTDYTKIDVEELLPHSGDMVLIDEMLEYGEDYGVSGVKVSSSDKFFEESIIGIHAAIGLEWMAQTIAAIAGIRALQENRPVQVGFLLGTRKYEPARNVFKLGEQFVIHVKQLYQEDNGLGAFQCSIHQGENLIAEAKLNVFAPDNVEKFLKGEGL